MRGNGEQVDRELPLQAIEQAGEQDAFQQKLTHWNRLRLRPGRGEGSWRAQLADEQLFRPLELTWLERERRAVHIKAREAPREAAAFVAWFAALQATGPGQGDPLFDYLALTASREELRWFIEQEVAGEAGFDDLVAMTQVKLPTQAKLELARNYWDEMGRGREAGMHGPMLEHLAQVVGAEVLTEKTVAEALALGNVMIGLAFNRRYCMQSVGALGVVELTAPTRAVRVVEGLKRLGYGLPEYRYFALHAVLDVKHSEAWNREVLASLVKADPSCATAIAEGALMRLSAGARCFERYRHELGV